MRRLFPNANRITGAIFAPIEAPAHQEGRVYYDATRKTFSLYIDEQDVSMQIGEENWINARNSTGATITNGTPVYISGVTGNRPNISPANANSATTCCAVGLATHDIENNTDGYVTVFGEVLDMDTQDFEVGDHLYVDTTDGQLTNVSPAFPNYSIMVCRVLISNPSNGRVLVNPGLAANNHVTINNLGAILFKAGDGTNYTETEADGTLVFNGDATVYEDLQVSISNVRIPPSNAPTWRQYDHGIVGGVTFPVLGFALNELVYFDVQTSHSMKLQTILDNHVHFMTPTDGTGDNFKFQLDVIAAPINGSWAAPTGTPFTVQYAITGDYTNAHKIFEMADIPAVNTTVSTLYKCKLTRIAASADEYASEVYVEFTDCHYKKDTIGSRLENAK